MTRDETGRILAVLKAVWPDATITPATVTAYALAWSDLEYSACNAAVGRYIRCSKWFPKPSELRAVVVEAACALPDAYDAWAEVQRNLPLAGPSGMPEWSTPVLARTMAVLGWRAYCLSDLSETTAWRAHFWRVYDSYRERALEHADIGVLADGAARRTMLGEVQG